MPAFLEEEEDQKLRDPRDPRGFLNAPEVTDPLNAGSPVPTGSLGEIMAQGPPPAPPVRPPAPVNPPISSDAYSRAKAAEEAALASRPGLPQPKWWQRGLAGVAGGLAGWSNAAGRTKNPIDVQALGQNILAPGYQGKLQDWQSRVKTAQEGVQAEKGNLDVLEGIRKLTSQESLNRADINLKTEEAKHYGEMSTLAKEARIEADRIAAESRLKTEASRQDDALRKIYGTDAWEQPEGAQIPTGYASTPLSAAPGRILIHPPPVVPLPPDLAPFARGRKTGDMIPYSEFKALQAKAEPAGTPKEITNAAQLLLDAKAHPERYSPEQIKEAQRQFGEEHRPPQNIIQIPGLGPGTPGSANSQTTRDEFLSSLPPGTAAQVKAIAIGKAVMPPLGTRGSGALLRDAVFRYDPQYSDQRAQIRKGFAIGKDANNIGSLNTATVHLDQLGEAAKALAQGSFRPGNQAYNYFSNLFGSPAPTNFESFKAAVSGELANALKGLATDVEIRNIANNVQASTSPQQMEGIVNSNLQLLHARLNTYQERYDQLIPGDTVYSPIMPTAKAIYAKHGIQGPQNPQNPAPGQYVKGHVYGGLEYLGGPPARAESWRKSQ